MKVFVFIIIVLISILYLQYYLKYKQDYQILQVYLDTFKLETLYEKYPIVIYDQIYDIEELLKTTLAYSYNFKKTFEIAAEKVYRNASKYVLLFSEDSDIALKIVNPKYKKDIKQKMEDSNVQYITIKLKEKQVLILPALWYYQTNNMDVKAIGLDDLISKWLYAIV